MLSISSSEEDISRVTANRDEDTLCVLGGLLCSCLFLLKSLDNITVGFHLWCEPESEEGVDAEVSEQSHSPDDFLSLSIQASQDRDLSVSCLRWPDPHGEQDIEVSQLIESEWTELGSVGEAKGKIKRDRGTVVGGWPDGEETSLKANHDNEHNSPGTPVDGHWLNCTVGLVCQIVEEGVPDNNAQTDLNQAPHSKSSDCQ